MGFCRKYTEFPIGIHFDYIGIRFLPAAFPLLFGIDAKTLSNQSPPLNVILPELSDWILAEIQPSDSFTHITTILGDKLADVIQNQQLEYDTRFLNSLDLIFQKNGFLDTERELDTGLSARQLRRIFNFYIGTTAKSFSNVVRFSVYFECETFQTEPKRGQTIFLMSVFLIKPISSKTSKHFMGLLHLKPLVSLCPIFTIPVSYPALSLCYQNIRNEKSNSNRSCTYFIWIGTCTNNKHHELERRNIHQQNQRKQSVLYQSPWIWSGFRK